MKRILTYTTFCLLLVFASCSEEQLEVYHGDNYVYFTYMNDKSPQKITFNFATDAPLLREGTVKVKMTLLGYLRGSIQNVAWTKCRTKYVKPLVHR